MPAKRWTALDVWVGIIGAIMALGTTMNEEMYLPASGGRYFWKGRECPGQSGQNDFEVWEDRSLVPLGWFLGLKLNFS